MSMQLVPGTQRYTNFAPFEQSNEALESIATIKDHASCYYDTATYRGRGAEKPFRYR